MLLWSLPTPAAKEAPVRPQLFLGVPVGVPYLPYLLDIPLGKQ